MDTAWKRWLSLAVRLGVIGGLVALLVRGWSQGNAMMAVLAAVNLIGLGAVMLASPAMDLTAFLFRSTRSAALRPEEGRWREFRGVPVTVRRLDHEFFVRVSDARKVCGAAWPQTLAAARSIPGERGEFLRARLLADNLERIDPMPDMRLMAFVHWLRTLR